MKRLSFYLPAVVLALTVWGISPDLRGQSQQNSTPQSAASSEALRTLKIRALHAEPGKPSLYELRFTTSDSLPPDAELVIEFPTDLDLGLLEMASSTSINGGFTISKERNLVRVRRTGLGATVPPGRAVDLKLGLIKNPENLSLAPRVSVELRSASGKVASVKRSFSVEFMRRSN